MTTPISEVFWGLVGPFLFMWLAAKALPRTIAALVREGDFATLLSPRRLQDAWFGTFWARTGPEVKVNASTKVLPLLDGRVVAGKLLDEPAVLGLEGVCLEIGAGAGYWVDIFSNKHMRGTAAPAGGHGAKQQQQMGRTKAVTRVYGVEPNPNQHVKLRQHIAAAGLEGVYEIVPVGIEDLGNPKKWDGRIGKESVDCIVTVLCLCSIPEPERHIRELYGYLKPGGRWYFYEHVQCSVAWYMKAYQRFVNLFWPQFLGGCQLCRPTGTYLREAGAWQSADIAVPFDAQWHNVVPHVIGVLTK
ncbi:methyltransferase [Microdochium bolleyi]|uniref:Methyltransferase n=1 Tax=Microdochium bolleyi TaxID=196109 RepID=A0A136J1J8_9PEZI|nr:methyltransferase [Microdochium bolleyi]